MCLGPAIDGIEATGTGSVLWPFMGLQKSHCLHLVLTGARGGTARRRVTSRSVLASSVRVWGWVRARLCSGCPTRCFRSENGLPMARAGVIIRDPACLATYFKGLWELGDRILRLGEHCFGHSHLQNYLGNGDSPLTFKSPRESNRLDLPSHSLHFLCADGRWHLSVKLREMSSAGPATWSWVCWSCSLPCDI